MDEADQSGNTTSKSGKSTPVRRHKRTKAEKEALRLKALREEFGGSPCDLDEPELPAGLSANAIRCAIKDASQTFRSGKALRPSAIAARTAAICGLTAEQTKPIKAWLAWLKDRRWVLRENDCSPVLAWSRSSVSNAAEWSKEVEQRWRNKLEQGARTNSSDSASETSCSAGVDPDHRGDTDVDHGDADGAGSSSTTAGDEDLFTERSVEEVAGALRRPEVPFPALRKGAEEWLANQFFVALEKGSDEELRAAARNLSEDPVRTRAAMARSLKCSRCVVDIFSQVGLPIPGQRP